MQKPITIIDNTNFISRRLWAMIFRVGPTRMTNFSITLKMASEF